MLHPFISKHCPTNLSMHFSAPVIVQLFLWLCFIAPVSAQPTEQEVKAVAIEKLAIFIQWPGSEGVENRPDFVIAVYNNEELCETIREIYRGHPIKSRKVRVVNFSDPGKMPDCEVVFIPKVKKSVLYDILGRARKIPALTVADTEGFAEEGCCINFYMDKGKLRFEINQSQMNALGFNVDYKLLSIARLVKPSAGL